MLLLGSLGSAGVEATGGTITEYTSGGITYRVHSFTSTGNTNFVVTSGGTVDYLIVAGGAGFWRDVSA
jgi:hypothetical protein